jgi:hypothetical protein
VDLPPHVQVARGQELLRLLWEPLAPSNQVQITIDAGGRESMFGQMAGQLAPEAAPALAPEDYSWQQVQHQQSQCHSQHILNLNACIQDGQVQHAASSTLDASVQLQQCGGIAEQRFLDLNDLIDDTRCQKSGDTPHALSDASTATPREPLEDISIYEVLDASLIADIMPADVAKMSGCKPLLATPGTPMQNNNAWQYLQPGHRCMPAQEHYPRPAMAMSQQACGQAPQPCPAPLQCPQISGQQVWSAPWQWSAPAVSTHAISNSIAPQFSGTCILMSN